MKRILLSAYACEPGRGSEPAVGWNTALGLSDLYEVWVITRSNNQEIIERELREHPKQHLHFIYYDLPKWISWWKHGGKGVQLYYYIWQIGIYKVAKKLCKMVKFDAIHHVTFVNYYKPSFLSLLPIPFIWGPVGGGETSPNFFWTSFGLRGIIYEIFRNVSRFLGELDPFVRYTARRSSLAIGTTQETAARLKKMGAKRVKIVSQVSLNNEDWRVIAKLPPNDSGILRFISIGRLLHWKGFHLGLEAFAQAHLDRAEYWFVGDGPERTRLEKMSKDFGVDNKVRFLGEVPRAKVLSILSECDVLIHPSLHESGGFVCLEAIAAGRFVLCLNLGGPSLLIDEETGVKIQVKTKKQVVDDLSNSMRCISDKRNSLLKTSLSIKEYAAKRNELENKNTILMNLYQEVIGK